MYCWNKSCSDHNPTRNQVAQLALNTLESGTVTAQDNTLNVSTTVGGATTQVTSGKVNYVYVTSNADYADDIDDRQATSIGTQNDNAIVELGEKLYEGKLKKYGEETNSRTNEKDSMGRPAVRWVYDNKEIGKYVKKDDLKFSFTGKAAKSEMFTKIGSSIANDLLAASPKNYDLTVYVDGLELTGTNGTKAVAASNYFEKNNTAAAGVAQAIGKGGSDSPIGVSGNGVLTEVFIVENSSGKDDVIITMTNTYLVKATADYSSAKESVTIEPVEINSDAADTNKNIVLPNFKTSISNDEFDVANVKEGDYLLVTWSYDDNDYITVKPAEVVTASVSEYTVTDYVIMGDQKYSYNKLVGTPEKSEEYTINQDAKVVLDAYGYIIFVDEAISTNSFIYIQRVADPAGLGKTASAAAYFTDGTTDTIQVKEVFLKNGTKQTSGSWLSQNANVHGWYTYIKASDGSYSLTVADYKDLRDMDSVKNAAVDPETQIKIVFNNKIRFLDDSDDANIGAKGIRGNANTIFIAVDSDDEITVATGVGNAPDVFIGSTATGDTGVAADAAEISWVAQDGYAKYVFIDISDCKGSVDSAVNAAEYLFVLNDTGNKTVVDGDTYYKFKVVIDGEETERWIEQSNAVVKGNLYYNVKTNSKDYITKATLVDGISKSTHDVVNLVAGNGDTITHSGKTMNIAGENYIIADAELNLVIGKTVPKPIKFNPDAAYELYQKTTASTVTGTLQKQNLTGTAFVVVDEAGSEVAKTVWIYISGAAEPADAAKITTQPAAKTEIDDSQTATLTVAATGDSLTYQWYKDGEAMSGEIGTSLTVTGLAVGTYTFQCEITNTDGTKVSKVWSNEAEVVVKAKVYTAQELADNAKKVLAGETVGQEATTAKTKIEAAKVNTSDANTILQDKVNAMLVKANVEADSVAAVKAAVEKVVGAGVTVAVAQTSTPAYTAPGVDAGSIKVDITLSATVGDETKSSKVEGVVVELPADEILKAAKQAVDTKFGSAVNVTDKNDTGTHYADNTTDKDAVLAAANLPASGTGYTISYTAGTLTPANYDTPGSETAGNLAVTSYTITKTGTDANYTETINLTAKTIGITANP